MASRERPNESECMAVEVSRNTKPWTSLIVCPFVDFVLACLLLGMATYFLASRITQLCTNLVSCWTGGNDQDEQRQQQQHQEQQRLPLQRVETCEQLITARIVGSAEARACLTCDRGGKLHGICTTCIMQVLGPQREQDAAHDSRPLFLQEIILDACRSKDFVTSGDENTVKSVAVVLERLQLRAPDENEKTCECFQQSNRTSCCSRAAACSCGPECTCMQSRETSDHSEGHPGTASDHDDGTRAPKNEKEVIESLYDELEQERNASAVAANESMAMITRLQEEKSSLLFEARQYQRIMEEKALYDHKAITLLKDMLLKREAEKTVLEEEIEISETRKSSSQEETSAAIKAVEEERLSVLERVRLLEQQLQLLRGNDNCTYSYQRKRTCDQTSCG